MSVIVLTIQGAVGHLIRGAEDDTDTRYIK